LAGPPAKAPPLAAAAILLAVGLFSVFGLASNGTFKRPAPMIAAFIGLMLLAGWRRWPEALHVTIFLSLAALAYRTPELGPHPFPLLNALLGYGLIVLSSRRLRESIGWLHTGFADEGVQRLALAATTASLVALPIWRALADSDVAETQIFANVPLWALPAVGLFFAVVNAGAEEAAFRGVLMNSLHSAVGPTVAVLLQAAAFGIIHYQHGVPDGAWGAGLSAGYGLILGVIRLRARGMLAPWMAHAITDAGIFVLLVVWT
jgi:membrane protease YdiL (CAAX protease family)